MFQCFSQYSQQQNWLFDGSSNFYQLLPQYQTIQFVARQILASWLRRVCNVMRVYQLVSQDGLMSGNNAANKNVMIKSMVTFHCTGILTVHQISVSGQTFFFLPSICMGRVCRRSHGPWWFFIGWPFNRIHNHANFQKYLKITVNIEGVLYHHQFIISCKLLIKIFIWFYNSVLLLIEKM